MRAASSNSSPRSRATGGSLRLPGEVVVDGGRFPVEPSLLENGGGPRVIAQEIGEHVRRAPVLAGGNAGFSGLAVEGIELRIDPWPRTPNTPRGLLAARSRQNSVSSALSGSSAWSQVEPDSISPGWRRGMASESASLHRSPERPSRRRAMASRCFAMIRARSAGFAMRLREVMSSFLRRASSSLRGRNRRSQPPPGLPWPFSPFASRAPRFPNAASRTRRRSASPVLASPRPTKSFLAASGGRRSAGEGSRAAGQGMASTGVDACRRRAPAAISGPIRSGMNAAAVDPDQRVALRLNDVAKSRRQRAVLNVERVTAAGLFHVERDGEREPPGGELPTGGNGSARDDPPARGVDPERIPDRRGRALEIREEAGDERGCDPERIRNVAARRCFRVPRGAGRCFRVPRGAGRCEDAGGARRRPGRARGIASSREEAAWASGQGGVQGERLERLHALDLRAYAKASEDRILPDPARIEWSGSMRIRRTPALDGETRHARAPGRGSFPRAEGERGRAARAAAARGGSKERSRRRRN